MSTDREIALEQALVAVIGAAKLRGWSTKELLDQANLLLIDHSKLRLADHPYTTNAMLEISNAHAEVEALLD